MLPESLGPDLPQLAAHVWLWFCELHAKRTGSGFGHNPITWEAMAAWAQLTRCQPSVQEVQWLQALDRRYLEIVAEASRKKNQQGKRP